MRKVVSNTTPLIALADIGQLDLLRQLYEEIYVPIAVMNEIESEPARTLVDNAPWIKKLSITATDQKALFRSRLHAGEVEAIILAGEIGADLMIMDDNAAKKTAKYLGLNVTGSLGILVKAKKMGYIEKVSTLMDKLIEDGLYIDQKTRQMVLALADEIE